MDLPKMFTTLLLTWMCLRMKNMVLTNCPDLCNCEYVVVDGQDKQNVKCSDLGLEEFPRTLSDTAVMVNVSYNKIKSLQKFTDVILLSLKCLDLTYNNLQHIHRNFFDTFPNLELLDLANNELYKIPCCFSNSLEILLIKNNEIQFIESIGIWENPKTIHRQYQYIERNVSIAENPNSDMIFQHFKILDLSFNFIERIQPCWFDSFPNLRYLNLTKNYLSEIKKLSCNTVIPELEVVDLSNNIIKSIEPGAINQLQKLRYFSLSHNSLTSIPEDIPSLDWLDISFNMISMLPEASAQKDMYPHEVFLIGGNPFHCDCELQWLKELYDSRKYLLKFIEVDRDKFVPVCKSPYNMTDTSWGDLRHSDFNCESSTEDELKEKMDESSKVESEFGTDHVILKAIHIGSSFVKLQWLKEGKLLSSEESMMLTYHPFGKKQTQQNIHVLTSIGRYTLKDLRPLTGYVICISYSTNKLTNKISPRECIEVMTEAQMKRAFLERSKFAWILLMAVVLSIVFLTWLLCICLGKRMFDNGNVDKKIKIE